MGVLGFAPMVALLMDDERMRKRGVCALERHKTDSPVLLWYRWKNRKREWVCVFAVNEWAYDNEKEKGVPKLLLHLGRRRETLSFYFFPWHQLPAISVVLLVLLLLYSPFVFLILIPSNIFLCKTMSEYRICSQLPVKSLRPSRQSW